MDTFLKLLVFLFLMGKFYLFLYLFFTLVYAHRLGWFFTCYFCSKNTFSLCANLKGVGCQVRAADCTTSNVGSCTWAEETACNSPTIYCGDEAECLVVTKSLNSSYWLESSSSNQQFQCRCPVGATANCRNPGRLTI